MKIIITSILLALSLNAGELNCVKVKKIFTDKQTYNYKTKEIIKFKEENSFLIKNNEAQIFESFGENENIKFYKDKNTIIAVPDCNETCKVIEIQKELKSKTTIEYFCVNKHITK